MIECLNCKTPFAGPKGRKYCCQSCAATHTQTGRKSHNKKIHRVCRCGAEIQQTYNRYCSEDCQRQAVRENKTEAMQAWLSGGDCPLLGSKSIAALLKQLRGVECEKCGWGEKHPITLSAPTQVEHKDGNSKNNSYSNLVILCPNCHSLTPTFGSLNRGKSTRPKRRSFQDTPTPCVVCKTIFVAKRSLDKYCSRKCSRRAAYEKRTIRH